MSRAVLRIEADTSAVMRAMGALRGTARSAQAAMTAEARSAAKARERIARDEAQHQRRLDLEMLRATRDAQRGRTQVTLAEMRAQSSAADRASREEMNRQRLTTRLYMQSERERTATMRREESERTRVHDREERRRAQATARWLATQRANDRLAARERERVASRIASGTMAGGRAVGAFATGMHGQFQDARRQRAATEHTLNSAFYQARIGDEEAAMVRSRLQREVASGSLRGLSMENVAEGIAQAQTQFNILAGESPQARARGMDRQIELMAFARNTYQDPGEVLRVAGMLQQQGVTGADQMETIRAMTGMAQAGSIELANVTREALGPLMQNIARSVNAGMTATQRAAAVRGAALETMAVGEVTARSGGRSRDMLNALAKTRGSITNERTQENLYARLRSAGTQGQALASQMFTVQNGRARLNDGTSAVGFLSQLVAGFGGDTNRVMNLLGAGGPGAPMVLDAQQRRLLLLLASQGQGGESIAQNVAGMQHEGARFGAADVERGRQMRDREAQTTIQANEETRLNALTDNTSKLAQLSTSFDNWARTNPMGAQVADAASGLFGGIFGGIMGGGARSIAPRAMSLVNGVRAVLGVGAGASTVAQVTAGVVGGAAGLGLGTLANRAIYSDQGTNRQGGQPAYTNAFSADFWRGAATSISQAFDQSLARATVRVNVDPHDAAQARSAAPAR